jgi:serine/threonine protein kinase
MRRYVIQEVRFEGAFGQVVRAERRIDTQSVAIQMIKLIDQNQNQDKNINEVNS